MLVALGREEPWGGVGEMGGGGGAAIVKISQDTVFTESWSSLL